MPKPSGDAVTDHRIPDGLGNDETEPGSATTGFTEFGLRVSQVHDDRLRARSASTTDRPAEIGRGGESTLFG